jgi:hypothetical protein
MKYFTNTEAIDAVNNDNNLGVYLRDDEGNRAWSLVYVSTDGWRGYYNAVATKKHGWIKVDGDWMTDNWDDAPTGNSSDEVADKLDRMAEEYARQGKKMAVVYTPTSNVFSTSYDVFTKELPQ